MNVLDLYEEFRATMGGAGTQTFEQAFLRGLSKVVHDLNVRLGEAIDAPSELLETDVGFPDYCDNVFFPGVKFYMQRSGAWAQDPDNESRQFYEMELRKVIGSAIYADENFATRNQE